jgi:hypothetical protein
MSLLSFVAYETVYLYIRYIGCVTNTYVFSVMKYDWKAEHTISSVIYERIWFQRL